MLQKYLVAELKDLCRTCGLGTSGTKPVLTSRLVNHLESVTTLSNIVSLDLGYQNLAMAHLSRATHHGHWELMTWRRFSIPIPSPMCPRELALNVSESMEPIRSLNLPSKSSVLLVEQQRQRTMSAGILERILLVIKVETLMYAFFPDIARPVLPGRVSEHFQLVSSCQEKPERMNSANNRVKKQNAIKLVQSLLVGRNELSTVVHVPQDMSLIFERERKKDDLADSLLQALAYSQWHSNSVALRKTFLSGNKLNK